MASGELMVPEGKLVADTRISLGPYCSKALIPNAEYQSSAGVSSSRLKVFMRGDPRVYWYQFLSGLYRPPSKDCFDFGTAVHDVALLGDHANIRVIPEEVLSKSGSRAGNAWKEWYAENERYECLKRQDYDAVLRAVQSLREHPMAGPLLEEPGECEWAYYAYDEPLRLRMRCKLDKYIPRRNLVLDIKSTEQPTTEWFAEMAVSNFGYWIQEYFYRRVLGMCGIKDITFLFIFISTTRPHTVDCYTLEPEWLEVASERVEKALVDLSYRMEDGWWQPDDFDAAKPLKCPRNLLTKVIR